MFTSRDAVLMPCSLRCFFFFNDTATTEIYTLSLHDALPIFATSHVSTQPRHRDSSSAARRDGARAHARDRKSTRLNSSHLVISYAVFCLKKHTAHREHRYACHLVDRAS